nr:F-box only protein 39-like [Leptinotarsa decemlineata]
MNCNCGSSSGSDKSGTKDEIRWAHLPSLVITKIFTMLDKHDRKNASEVCKNWRREYFQPRFWPTVTFFIENNNLEKSRFLTNIFGSNVKHVKIIMDSFSKACIEELFDLMQKLAWNNKLKTLSINPTHCDLETFKNQVKIRWESVDWKEVMTQFEICLPRLTEFSIGCLGILPLQVDWILEKLNPKSLKILRLASFSRNPPLFNDYYFNPILLRSFVKLEVLSIDYDQLCDEVLETLNNAINFKILVVHLHGFHTNHEGTTERAWGTFKKNHPGIILNLILVHALKQVNILPKKVLRKQMPLKYLQIYSCDKQEQKCDCRIMV